MARVSRVDCRPSLRWPASEKLLAVRTPLAADDPRVYIVGIMASMALVVDRELLDGTIASLNFVEFVRQRPLVFTPAAGDGRDVVDWRLVD